MAMSSQTAPSHVLSIASFHWCSPNSSPWISFKPLNATPLKGTNHNFVKFPRERTRTRATLDDIERDQLSSTPLLVEEEKPKKVCFFPMHSFGFPLNLRFLRLLRIWWKVQPFPVLIYLNFFPSVLYLI